MKKSQKTAPAKSAGGTETKAAESLTILKRAYEVASAPIPAKQLGWILAHVDVFDNPNTEGCKDYTAADALADDIEVVRWIRTRKGKCPIYGLDHEDGWVAVPLRLDIHVKVLRKALAAPIEPGENGLETFARAIRDIISDEANTSVSLRRRGRKSGVEGKRGE